MTLERFKYDLIVVNNMETDSPEETIENYLSDARTSNLSTLARISGTSVERVKYVVRGLRDEGKVRYHADEQVEGGPVVEWTGT